MLIYYWLLGIIPALAVKIIMKPPITIFLFKVLTECVCVCVQVCGTALWSGPSSNTDQALRLPL